MAFISAIPGHSNRDYTAIPFPRTGATENLHHRSSDFSKRINAALQRMMLTTATPMRAKEIAERLQSEGISFGGTDAAKSVYKRLSYMPWVVALSCHGYWHRGRSYAPAGWVAEAEFAEGVTVRPAPALPPSGQVIQGDEMERHRLRRAWSRNVGDIKHLLDASLRFVMAHVDAPVGDLATIREGLEALGVPSAVCRTIKMRQIKSLPWMDNVRGNGMWPKGRPVPEGYPTADGVVRAAAETYLRRKGDWARADEVLADLKARGMVLTDRANDEISILRGHINGIPSVEGRTSVGYRIR